MHTIYVAGPVLRSESSREASELVAFYKHLGQAAKDAGVGIRLPVSDPDLDRLTPGEFAVAILRQIAASDSLLALIDAPDARPSTNLAVAGEAHAAAMSGKPVAVVARSAEQVPRLLRGLATFTVPYNVNFSALLRALVEESGPTPAAAAGVG